MGDYGIQIAIMFGILVLFLLFKPRNVIGDTSKTQLETVGRQKNAATIAGEWVKGIFRKNEVEERTPAEIKKQEEEASRKNWMVLIALFVIAICIAYILPDDASMFFKLGVVVVAPLHLMGLWLLFFTGSEVSTMTKVMVIGYFTIAAIGLILPEPMYQTWKDTKAATKAMDRPTFFKEIFSNSSPANSTRTNQQNGVTSVVVDVPIDSSVVTTAPLGYRLSSMECPAENVVEIVEPASKTVLKQIDCAGTIRLAEHEIRNMEFVIFQKPGATKPSQVTTWWKKG